MSIAILGLLVLPGVIGAEEVPHELPVVEAAVAATAPAVEAAEESLVEPAEIAVTLPERTLLGSYPRCGTMNGSACSSPGSYAQCQWNQYEPDFCLCLENHTWQCPG